MKPRRFRSFAKVNLGLEVIGKLPSGYHEIKTLFATLSVHDIVEVAETKSEVRVRSDHPDVPGDETNLAHRAAALMQRMSGRRGGLAIRIEKRIPIGGGLGGGSSNAATVLRALDLMWGLGRGAEGLVEAAKTLGADVPYFLLGGPALGLGRGDQIRALDLQLPKKVLLVPGCEKVSTAAVFARLAPGRPTPRTSRIDAFLRSREEGQRRRNPRTLSTLRNDLERAAAAESPSLAAVARRVRIVARTTGALHAALSGSGSSFFLLFDDAADEGKAALFLKDAAIPSRRCSFVSKRSFLSRFEIQGSED